MVRRSRVTLEDIADLDNLAFAFWRAVRGKRHRPEVQRFMRRLDAELAQLRTGIMDLSVPVGEYASFRVWDPKPRLIHAPCFRERVLHHAMMNHLGPVLDRALVDDTFACRVGKGAYAAAQRAQQHVRRFPWYVQLDMRSYFASIDHAYLRGALARRFRDPGVLALCARVIAGHSNGEGRGLPIGALTSQHFANLYLDALDRFLLEDQRGAGLVRYMDDVVCFAHSRSQAREVLASVAPFLQERLKLQLRDSGILQRSELGLPFVGFRIYPGTIRLSRRRMARYRRARKHWELAYERGQVDALSLQAGYASALAITAHVDSTAWRRQELQRRPAPDA